MARFLLHDVTNLTSSLPFAFSPSNGFSLRSLGFNKKLGIFPAPKPLAFSPFSFSRVSQTVACTARNKFLKDKIPLVADYIPLDVLYEDECILVINKPAGVKHEPLHRFVGGSLVNRVIGYLKKEPYTVHRLDMYTSGVVCFAKSKSIASALATQFRSHNVEKRYLAIVLGQIFNDFEVDAPIGRNPNHKFSRMVCSSGQPAKTKFCVLASSKISNVSLLEAQIFQGRTHQIRVHLQHSSYPILGDEIYGSYIKKNELTGNFYVPDTARSDPRNDENSYVINDAKNDENSYVINDAKNDESINNSKTKSNHGIGTIKSQSDTDFKTNPDRIGTLEDGNAGFMLNTDHYHLHAMHLNEYTYMKEGYGVSSMLTNVDDNRLHDAMPSNDNVFLCQYMRRQALHACYLRLLHPATHKSMEFKSSLPNDMQNAIRAYFSPTDLHFFYFWMSLYLNN